MKRIGLKIAALGLGLAACGGPGSINGTVQGQPVAPVQDAIAITSLGGSGTSSVAGIFIASVPSLCTRLNANSGSPKNAQGVLLLLGTVSGQSVAPPSATGDYLIVDQTSTTPPSGNVAFGGFFATDASCKSTSSPLGSGTNGSSNPTLAVSGKVTLTKSDLSTTGRMTGSFDITLKDGDHLTGSFDAPICQQTSDGGSGPADGGCN